MDNKKQLGLLLYRQGKKGLEVLLVPSENNTYSLPTHASLEEWEDFEAITSSEDHIELEVVNCDKRNVQFLARALELDWTKLPEDSLRRRFYELNKGAYVASKEAFKKVLPAEYTLLKELLEVVSVRNLLKNL